MISIINQYDDGRRKYRRVGLPCEKMITKPISKDIHTQLPSLWTDSLIEVLKNHRNVVEGSAYTSTANLASVEVALTFF